MLGTTGEYDRSDAGVGVQSLRRPPRSRRCQTRAVTKSRHVSSSLREEHMKPYVVVGGGLAGLTAANALGDAGRKVTLFEQSERLGGRAITQEIAQENREYRMNLGPHALYCGGVATRTFRGWNIPMAGARPDLRTRAYLVRGGERYPFFTN